MLAAVILAAGESRRMGQPKALLPFPDLSDHKRAGLKSAPTIAPTTFLEHLLEVTRHERVGALRVVLGAHAEEIRARVKLADESVVVNREWEMGQLSSLQAALRSLPPQAEAIIVCLVDHPLISRELVAKLIEAFDRTKHPIVIPTFRGRRGHPVIFPRKTFDELLNAPADVGARAVVRAHAASLMEVATEEEGVVMNLNDPATLQRATEFEV
jgi:molybdenum cofactor cytidylyltransferase